MKSMPETDSPPESSEKLVQPVPEGNLAMLADEKTARVITLVVYVLLVFLGVGTGYLLSTKIGLSLGGKPTMVKTERTVGLTDVKTFKDQAEGTVEKDGIDGEGTHKLTREGGPSQTVYLVSSVVNLDDFIGKKVRVWGETFAAKRAGWLMDVGKVEILE